MKKGLPFFFCVLVLFICFIKPVFATSSYVLPYPSYMPGSVMYKVHLLLEKITRSWYFGDFGQFEYNLKQSDKYLVEAKTLFDYKQYLLGFKALEQSDKYFNNVYPNLMSAQRNGKNISVKIDLLKEASLKHVEELSLLKNQVPQSFLWKPEKVQSTNLNLKDAIEQSIKIRKKIK